MKHKASILVSTIAIFGIGAIVAHAQSYTPLAPIEGLVNPETGKTDISTYLSGALPLIITLGAAFAVLMGILGGVKYVAAGITPDAKSGAKEQIAHALVGLALVLSSYMILNTINPNLLKFSFFLEPIAPPTVDLYDFSLTEGDFAQIDGLNLNENSGIKIIAMEIKDKFPNVTFTSGKRTMLSQASAMADNIAKSGNKNWIKDTYSSSNSCANMLQSWVDSNPTAITDRNKMTSAFRSIMENNPGICGNLSRHFSGDAFDIQPVTSGHPTASEIEAIVKSHGGTFLPEEGGLLRWHVQL